MSVRPIVVLCPHFAPDTAPTGVVMTRIVEELVQRGHEVHVVTSLPWYRQHQVEKEWQGKGKSCEITPWGSITRVSPFAGKDKSHIARRAVGFVGFSVHCLAFAEYLPAVCGAKHMLLLPCRHHLPWVSLVG